MTTTIAGRALATTAVAALMTAAPVAASAADLVPHRAVYDMTLDAARPASGIAGARGNMVFKFSDGCDGWTVENTTELVIDHLDRPRMDTAWKFVAWESKDGDRYRFWVSTSRGGRVTEEIEGNAERSGDGGVARFTAPQDMTVDLPAGTLFPTEHTLRLLQAAEAGQRLLLRTVFDGTEVEGAARVNAVIGPRQAPGEAPVPGGLDDEGAALLDAPSWHMDLAFFPLQGDEAQPDYEVGLRYRANGVGTDIRQDFGSFALQGTLQSLEPLPRPDC